MNPFRTSFFSATAGSPARRQLPLRLLGASACAVMALNLPCAQAALVASYDFDSGLTDTLGNGADLVASGGVVGGGRYSFDWNQGLRLTSALPSTTDYAIEIKMTMDDDLSGYNKLIDFQDLAADAGMYVLSGQINFYPIATAGSVSLGSEFTVGLSRSGGMLEMFLNGTSLGAPFADSGAGVPASNILNFFEDDFATGQAETFAGSADWIRIHEDASTFGDRPTGRVPETGQNLLLLGMGLLACQWLRPRRRAAAPQD